MPVLTDAAAERAVLAGICEYGADMYLDICDMVKVGTFSINSNQCLWKCLDHICKENDDAQVDLPSILSSAKELGLDHIIERSEEAKHLNSILKLHVDRSNVRKFAGKIRKLEVARLVHKQAEVLQEKMSEITGSESISQILGTAEEVIFDFTSLLDEGDSNPTELGCDLEEYLNFLEKNPVSQMGISTGFPEWDEAIGGGLRPGTLNVIAARPKTGKTILSDNMGFNIADQEEVPVLNLDTEMLREDHQHRATAMLAGVPIRDIETGQFGQQPDKRIKVYDAAKKLKEAKYFHRSIAGQSFEDQLALMRRWLQREVGLKPDGTAEQCVIVYDYLKLMDSVGISDSLREFQLLGFMMSTLHNFAVRYRVPFVILMQLNRDGINQEGTDTASGSDRIIWLCSNFTIFKKKSEEEIAEDGPDAGNRKFVVVVTRHGEGTEFGDYINLHMDGWCARIREGQRKANLGAIGDDDEFVVNDNDDDDGIPFD
jgi:replicative DNA helicase